MNPSRSPVGTEIFAQWQRARGKRMEPASRPLSRDWEELLERAGLASATERADAENDARALASEGWIELTPLRYRPHRIGRVVVPLAAESRWAEAFGFIPPTDEDIRRIRDHPWEPALAFVRDTRVNLPFTELRLLDDFIKQRRHDCDLVPIKERSLQIFGDEKRLDAIGGSALFREGRLDVRRDFRCESVGVPLGWKRGPSRAADRPMIVLENAATWHSYCRWNTERGLFGAVVYGDGNRFIDGIRYLTDVFGEIGGARKVYYFGDLDPQGLAIPQDASSRGNDMGLPPVEPHLWSYRQLLRLGREHAQPSDVEMPSRELWDWLQECAEPVRRLFADGRRIAQEQVGWDFLREIRAMDVS
jgi:hypothetical protein